MKSITRFVLKRPVTVIMAVLCLIYFGLSSVLGMPMELSPETEMPILMVMTAYPGASPEDVNELVTKELEEEAGSLSGVKTVGSTSSENISVMTLQYEYGTDIDEAYDDLKKKVDLVAADLPEDAQTPVIMEMDSIARYQGEDTISLAVTKQQSVTAVELSEQVKEAVDDLLARDSDLRISIINDSADSIRSSLSSAAFSLFLAVVIAMVIIWLFFGELKASLIVGSSIPLSILATLILMSRMGFSLNMITLNSLVLGVGMMVDNSIVVLESCFRMSEGKETGFLEYRKHALEGTGTVAASIMGGTATTCVVFLPLAFMKGMSAQVFGPLAYTIVFCMVASLFSAITIVPLCYMTYKPVEKKKAPLSGLMEELQEVTES